MYCRRKNFEKCLMSVFTFEFFSILDKNMWTCTLHLVNGQEHVKRLCWFESSKTYSTQNSLTDIADITQSYFLEPNKASKMCTIYKTLTTIVSKTLLKIFLFDKTEHSNQHFQYTKTYTKKTRLYASHKSF